MSVFCLFATLFDFPRLSVFMYLSVALPVCLSVCLPACLSNRRLSNPPMLLHFFLILKIYLLGKVA